MHALLDLTGRTAVVTGAAEGIGAEIAQHLAAAGAATALLDRNEPGAAALAADLVREGARSEAIEVDIADEASVSAAMAAVHGCYGRIDILVNNAGIQDRETLLDCSGALWDRLASINARGPFLCLREAAKLMRSGAGGRIINISSIGSIHPVMPGLAAYNAAKSAVNGLTRSAALELAPRGITVNAVLPGGVATAGAARSPGPPPVGRATAPPPLGEGVEASDIAAIVLFLASPAARRITGQLFVVDGGYLLG